MRNTESASPGVVAALIGVRGSISVRRLPVAATAPAGGLRSPTARIAAAATASGVAAESSVVRFMGSTLVST